MTQEISHSVEQQEFWFDAEAQRTLKRILPRLESGLLRDLDEGTKAGFLDRLNRQFPRLFRLQYALYGKRYDFFYHLQDLLERITAMWIARPDELKALDALREDDRNWFISNRMVGAMCYVDLFADNLEGITNSIPYFQELGITYLHIMPIFRSPEGDDDGGFAVSSYRDLNPEFGSIADLLELSRVLRSHGISLVLDFIFNHTSDEHDWARRAQSGDLEYQQYYRMYPDRVLPDQFEEHLGEIFPEEHPGAFTYRTRMKKWVWTSFHTYQWDLNYENPAVFNAMTEEMLFLANLGVEVLRLDAVAFIWKELGTSCENLPGVHQLVQAFNAVIQIVAPAIALKSEAIVHPDEVGEYISADECQLSYNPNLMALLWSTLSTRDVGLLHLSLKKRFSLPNGCAWVNYIRCHDDIGWAFSDEDAKESRIDGKEHRRFLNKFFTGEFKGSFAKGLPFQFSEKTGDMRISGTTASLAGLEGAIEADDKEEIELSIQRVLLLHGVILTIGGIPLIYLGDEIGMLNDRQYLDDSEKLGDSRWVHRPLFDWERAELRHDADSIPGRIFSGLQRLVQIRTQTLAFARAETEIIETNNPHVLGFFRIHEEQTVLILANFSEKPQSVQAGPLRQRGLKKVVTDIVAGQTITALQSIDLAPLQFMVIVGVR